MGPSAGGQVFRTVRIKRGGHEVATNQSQDGTMELDVLVSSTAPRGRERALKSSCSQAVKELLALEDPGPEDVDTL